MPGDWRVSKWITGDTGRRKYGRLLVAELDPWTREKSSREIIMRKPKTPPEEEVSIDAGFAALRRAVEERFARMPPREEAVAPNPGHRQTAAEMDLFRIEMAYRIQAALCPDPGRCAKHRCRRHSRCQELAEIAPMVDEQRALVAKERAAAVATGATDGSADASAAVVAEAGQDGCGGARPRTHARKKRGARPRRRQRKH